MPWIFCALWKSQAVFLRGGSYWIWCPLKLLPMLLDPEGVSGFNHNRHPWSHELATAVGIEHSIPFNSKMLSKYC